MKKGGLTNKPHHDIIKTQTKKGDMQMFYTSDLIKKLAEMIQEHGDQPLYSPSGYYAIEDVILKWDDKEGLSIDLEY